VERGYINLQNLIAVGFSQRIISEEKMALAKISSLCLAKTPILIHLVPLTKVNGNEMAFNL
jgi:hypothetical protein